MAKGDMMSKAGNVMGGFGRGQDQQTQQPQQGGVQPGGRMARGMFGFNQSPFGAGLGNMMSGIAGRGTPFQSGGFNQQPAPSFEQGGIKPNFGGPMFGGDQQSGGFAGGGGFRPDISPIFSRPGGFGGYGSGEISLPQVMGPNGETPQQRYEAGQNRLRDITGGNTGIAGGMDFSRLFGSPNRFMF